MALPLTRRRRVPTLGATAKENLVITIAITAAAAVITAALVLGICLLRTPQVSEVES